MSNEFNIQFHIAYNNVGRNVGFVSPALYTLRRRCLFVYAQSYSNFKIRFLKLFYSIVQFDSIRFNQQMYGCNPSNEVENSLLNDAGFELSV